MFFTQQLQVDITDKIGDDEEQGLLLQTVVERLDQRFVIRRFSQRIELHHLFDRPVDREELLARFTQAVLSVCKDHMAEKIGILHCREAQSRHHFGGNITLLLHRSKIHRSAQHRHHHNIKLTLLFVDFDEGFPQLRGRLPVDLTDIIPIDILTQLGKLEPLTLKERSIIPEHITVDLFFGLENDLFDCFIHLHLVGWTFLSTFTFFSVGKNAHPTVPKRSHRTAYHNDS